MLEFNDAILFRWLDSCNLVNYTFRGKLLLHRKLFAITSTNSLNNAIKLIFNLCDEACYVIMSHLS